MQAPSAAEMKGFAGRSDAAGWRQLAIHLALLLASGTLVALAPGWWALPAMLLLGVVQVALFAPFHETSHYTAFANRRVNAVVGWLSGRLSVRPGVASSLAVVAVATFASMLWGLLLVATIFALSGDLGIADVVNGPVGQAVPQCHVQHQWMGEVHPEGDVRGLVHGRRSSPACGSPS